jgi:hypothetical protein
VLIENALDHPVKLYWMDFDGVEVEYVTWLEPGQRHVQPTFVDHVWRVRNARTGRLELEAEATATTEETWRLECSAWAGMWKTEAGMTVGVGSCAAR